jgi:hypothetical protein
MACLRSIISQVITNSLHSLLALEDLIWYSQSCCGIWRAKCGKQCREYLERSCKIWAADLIMSASLERDMRKPALARASTRREASTDLNVSTLFHPSTPQSSSTWDHHICGNFSPQETKFIAGMIGNWPWRFHLKSSQRYGSGLYCNTAHLGDPTAISVYCFFDPLAHSVKCCFKASPLNPMLLSDQY